MNAVQLEEAVCSWTKDLELAKIFKGGVPDPPVRGVILKNKPTVGEIVIGKPVVGSSLPDGSERCP